MNYFRAGTKCAHKDRRGLFLQQLSFTGISENVPAHGRELEAEDL